MADTERDQYKFPPRLRTTMERVTVVLRNMADMRKRELDEDDQALVRRALDDLDAACEETGLARRASPAAAVPGGALPPLPAPWQDRSWSEQPPAELDPEDHTNQLLAEIADWRAFGAAVEADRAQRPEKVLHWPHDSTDEACSSCGLTKGESRLLYDLKRGEMVAVSADRAQQGEPVAWMNPSEGCAMDAFLWQKDASNPQYSVPVYRAATKAAAPDTGIPTVERAARALIAAFDDPSCHIASLNNYVRDLENELSGRAPVSTTPTSGEVEKAGLPLDVSRITGVVQQERRQHEVVVKFGRSKTAAERFLHEFGAIVLAEHHAAPSHPSEAKAGETGNV